MKITIASEKISITTKRIETSYKSIETRCDSLSVSIIANVLAMLILTLKNKHLLKILLYNYPVKNHLVPFNIIYPYHCRSET